MGNTSLVLDILLGADRISQAEKDYLLTPKKVDIVSKID